ncbi:tetratricopeptide repeat protein [Galbibacter sp. EGI 63066]|uniref:tetratricopeptide repeat protein n=1 Tax=Galbibacter sp. EGI 63066 TaxID=2993559 RepID=UPI002248F65C|nr:tetratricopeptide repeat protein [Galbibacter sp. EGI 63066]MCX2680597.1 tetratricopeptide repeat protein [Galbibacter sp. EGI 63066]
MKNKKHISIKNFIKGKAMGRKSSRRFGILSILLLFAFLSVKAQESDGDKQKEKALLESIDFTYEGNKELTEDNDIVEAEMAYRKAISKSSENGKAKYNLGNVYYNNNSMGEAFMRYKEAGLASISKEDKHKAFHNLGNVFMKNKEYKKAVEAYKEALRNIPSDEETRYNLALAKEMLKKQQDEQKNNEDKNKDKKDDKGDKDQNKENQDDQDQKQDEDSENKKDDENKEGDKKDDQGENSEDKKQDQGDQNKNKQDQQKQEGKPQGQQQPRPNQLSPQQIKNILEAMNNEEKKVQEKVNARKVKGTPIKSEKDW